MYKNQLGFFFGWFLRGRWKSYILMATQQKINNRPRTAIKLVVPKCSQVFPIVRDLVTRTAHTFRSENVSEIEIVWIEHHAYEMLCRTHQILKTCGPFRAFCRIQCYLTTLSVTYNIYFDVEINISLFSLVSYACCLRTEGYELLTILYY